MSYRYILSHVMVHLGIQILVKLILIKHYKGTRN